MLTLLCVVTTSWCLVGRYALSRGILFSRPVIASRISHDIAHSNGSMRVSRHFLVQVDADRKEVTLDDIWSLDLSKLTEYKV
jgi:hypothetical protein